MSKFRKCKKTNRRDRTDNLFVAKLIFARLKTLNLNSVLVNDEIYRYNFLKKQNH